MSETGWMTGADTTLLLGWLRRAHRVATLKAGRRKLRLFAVACCRRLEHLGPGDAFRRALATAERYAEGPIDEEERGKALTGIGVEEKEARHAWHQQVQTVELADRNAFLSRPMAQSAARSAVRVALHPEAFRAARDAATVAAQALARDAVGPYPGDRKGWKAAIEVERPFQCALLREVFGNPFRAVSVDPNWLAWNDRTVPRLAQALYDERAFDRLSLLGDALEDAGCGHRDLLDHLRGGGPHVLGCWALDLVLAKRVSAKGEESASGP